MTQPTRHTTLAGQVPSPSQGRVHGWLGVCIEVRQVILFALSAILQTSSSLRIPPLLNNVNKDYSSFILKPAPEDDCPLLGKLCQATVILVLEKKPKSGCACPPTGGMGTFAGTLPSLWNDHQLLQISKTIELVDSIYPRVVRGCDKRCLCRCPDNTDFGKVELCWIHWW